MLNLFLFFTLLWNFSQRLLTAFQAYHIYDFNTYFAKTLYTLDKRIKDCATILWIKHIKLAWYMAAYGRDGKSIHNPKRKYIKRSPQAKWFLPQYTRLFVYVRYVSNDDVTTTRVCWRRKLLNPLRLRSISHNTHKPILMYNDEIFPAYFRSFYRLNISFWFLHSTPTANSIRMR